MVRERCHELARRARNELGLEGVTPDSKDFFRQMVTLRLPKEAPADLKERLYDEHRIEIPVFERGDDRFIRPSFQGTTTPADLERLRRRARCAALGRVRERVLEHVERLLGRSREHEALPERLSSTATVSAFVTRLQSNETSMPSAER